MFSMICAWTNGWANNRDAGDLRPSSRSLWRHCNVFFILFQNCFVMYVLSGHKLPYQVVWNAFNPWICQSRVYGIMIRICLLLPVFIRPPLITWYTRCFWLANMFGFNTLSLRQNGRHFVDIFKHIFLNENVWIFIKVLTKTLALVRTMAWRRKDHRPLSEAAVA